MVLDVMLLLFLLDSGGRLAGLWVLCMVVVLFATTTTTTCLLPLNCARAACRASGIRMDGREWGRQGSVY